MFTAGVFTATLEVTKPCCPSVAGLSGFHDNKYIFRPLRPRVDNAGRTRYNLIIYERKATQETCELSDSKTSSVQITSMSRILPGRKFVTDRATNMTIERKSIAVGTREQLQMNKPTLYEYQSMPSDTILRTRRNPKFSTFVQKAALLVLEEIEESSLLDASGSCTR
ncbi:hypothetical protein Tcan_03630 [Toxocara canis]|uniref:Uncharacterized protein n=1 Tax=Toxocara canis TaxID=6265 RepID=A0A0B2VBU7_TOXCA|nr:hypothetical protein Tcan_03630 [Toxocara canis]